MKKNKEIAKKISPSDNSVKQNKTAAEIDSDEEEKAISLLKKKSIPQQDLSSTQTKFNIQQSKNFSMNLLKERGCSNYYFIEQGAKNLL